jgi:hypothetical protein
LIAASPALAFTLSPAVATAQSNVSTHSITSSAFSAGANTAVILQGNVTGLNNASDTLSITDSTGGAIAWAAAYQCPTPSATTKISFSVVGYTTAGFTSKTVTVADTAVAGTNWASGAALFISTVTGTASSSVEDAAARACGGSTTPSTNPSVTSGVPTGSGEFFVATYNGQRNSSGATYTEDTGNGWTLIGGAFGGANQSDGGGYQVNAGSGALTHNPTVSSAAYSHQIIALCPSGGCGAPAPMAQSCVIGGGLLC